MAPKRKPSNDTAAATTTTTTRVTRSSTRLATATVTPPAADPKSPKKKKARTTTTTTATADKKVAAPASAAKTIIIERCTQCSQFKNRAILVKDGLEKEVKGVNVVVNPEKPRRGCFEIREKGGEIFISLLDMKRPFKPMRALDMDQVISDIVEKIR